MPFNKLVLIETNGKARQDWIPELRNAGFEVIQANNQAAALRLLERARVDAIVSEMSRGCKNCLSLLSHLQIRKLGTPVIFVATMGCFRSGIEAMKAGAADVLEEPVDAEMIVTALRAAVKNIAPATSRVHVPEVLPVAKSTSMKQLLSVVKRVAAYDANILLCGESGAGKEVIAREIHRTSPRNSRPFVPINCALLSESLLENELFGHEKGAFTGANERKIGVFEASDGGTLFLDEVNEIGLACQAKLLRALERKEFRRLGGTNRVKVSSRLIFATNTSLEDQVKARRFREDLYYRIKVLTLTVPPLRSRKEDILPLIQTFLHELGVATGRWVERITPEALAKLVAYSWPGNVRELKNVIESSVLLSDQDILGLRDLPATLHTAGEPRALSFPVGITLGQAERQMILHYLNNFPTKKAAAKALGIGLRTLHFKLKKFAASSGTESSRSEP